MTGDDLVSALDLPATCRVGRRIPKTLLVEQGALAAADKRHVTEGIERIDWQAVVKPDNAGVPGFRDADREYLEIAVIRAELRADADRGRLRELLHRVVPYPVVLVENLDGCVTMSLAHKRYALTSTAEAIIDGDIRSCSPDADADSSVSESFRQALAVGRQPRESMLTLYTGWMDTLVALQAAQITGAFHEAGTRGEAAAQRDALKRHDAIAGEMASLRTAAKKTKQSARLAEINIRLQHLKASLAETLVALSRG